MSARYVTARAVAAAREQMTPLDRDVLVTLGRCRVATTEQLRRLVAPDAQQRAWQARMARLTRLRAVARLPRRVGGVVPGSAPWPYVLDVTGWRLLGREAPQRPTTPGVAFLRHALLVTETYAIAATVARSSGSLSVATFAAEPACWRPMNAGGLLKPDARLVLAAPGVEDHYFLEIDTGSESMTAIDRKLLVYRQHWASGREQAETGVFPKVLFVTLANQRTKQLQRQFIRQPTAARALFDVTTFGVLMAYLTADLPEERPPPTCG